MNENHTDLPELPTTPDAFLLFVKERQDYWKARIDQTDPHGSTRRRMVNLLSDVLDLRDSPGPDVLPRARRQPLRREPSAARGTGGVTARHTNKA